MKRTSLVLNIATAAMSLVVLSCLVSTMALFMGAGQAGVDLNSLMHVQIVSVPVAVALVLLVRFLPGRSASDVTTYRRLYAAVPQWLIFVFLMLNLLVISGEIALLVAARTTSEVIEWTAHAPLVSMFASSLAICALYGRAQQFAGRPVAFSGRWAP